MIKDWIILILVMYGYEIISWAITDELKALHTGQKNAKSRARTEIGMLRIAVLAMDSAEELMPDLHMIPCNL